MSYFKKNCKWLLLCAGMVLSFNLYFIVLMRDRNVAYLYYLDFLILTFFLVIIGVDFGRYRKDEKEKRKLMQGDDVVSLLLSDFENKDIAEHDVQVLKEKLQEQFRENCELQDYVAKWCHEFKIPLSASLLMDEKIEDRELRNLMRGQLEKMNQQVNSMMLGCKMQSPLFDLQIKKVSLPECVKSSVRNNQFFLIQKGFSMKLQVEEHLVYSDPAWLVYVLDQLISNALKYVREEPKISIWTEAKEKQVQLFIEDNGEGIKDCDVGRIFEKGFTGSNYHNGKYKSTGMGLYMVSKIIGRLGHEIRVESQYGAYTRFCIVFKNNDYFML
ncbi:MAG: sensor histidine kinase [Bacillota bacterium]|nr:sensor histidine kinase [Bacillota bacterium]